MKKQAKFLIRLSVRSAFWPAVVLIAAFTGFKCHAPHERVHIELSASAFLSSDGIQRFLADVLGSTNAPFADAPFLDAKPPPFQEFITSFATPMGWVLEGSYYEDMMDAIALRSSDHF